MAGRSYSLETLGQHPTQSLTPPLLRAGIQRGGSLKIPATVDSSAMTTSAPSTSRQTHQPRMSTFGYSVPTVFTSSKCQRVGSGIGDRTNRPNERAVIFSSSAQRPPVGGIRPRPQLNADLVYAQRVLVSNEPPQEPPPPLPVHRSLIARLIDPDMHVSNSCDF